jgi:competence protein ComEA
LPSAQPPLWTPAAQRATFFLVIVLGALLGWHVWSGSRYAARPSDYEPDFRVDLNHADAALLRQLPGVGDVKAQAIVELRRQKGGFRYVEELMEVSGIGVKTLERLRDRVFIEPLDRPESEEQDTVVRPEMRKPAPKPMSKPAGTRKGDNLTEPIDVNRATSDELQALPGIGPTLAGRIVETRGKQPFRTVDDLRRVPGIGAKTLDRLRPHVTVAKDNP